MAGSTLPAPCSKPAVRSLQTLHATGNAALDLGLFRDFQRIIDLDAQISDQLVAYSIQVLHGSVPIRVVSNSSGSENIDEATFILAISLQ